MRLPQVANLFLTSTAIITWNSPNQSSTILSLFNGLANLCAIGSGVVFPTQQIQIDARSIQMDLAKPSKRTWTHTAASICALMPLTLFALPLLCVSIVFRSITLFDPTIRSACHRLFQENNMSHLLQELSSLSTASHPYPLLRTLLSTYTSLQLGNTDSERHESAIRCCTQAFANLKCGPFWIETGTSLGKQRARKLECKVSSVPHFPSPAGVQQPDERVHIFQIASGEHGAPPSSQEESVGSVPSLLTAHFLEKGGFDSCPSAPLLSDLHRVVCEGSMPSENQLRTLCSFFQDQSPEILYPCYKNQPKGRVYHCMTPRLPSNLGPTQAALNLRYQHALTTYTQLLTQACKRLADHKPSLVVHLLLHPEENKQNYKQVLEGLQEALLRFQALLKEGEKERLEIEVTLPPSSIQQIKEAAKEIGFQLPDRPIESID